MWIIPTWGRRKEEALDRKSHGLGISNRWSKTLYGAHRKDMVKTTSWVTMETCLIGVNGCGLSYAPGSSFFD